ncbi:MAG: catalase family protein [Acidobacteria bacterium]|nr:catalase family protein [Acidobacteriota bacterium]
MSGLAEETIGPDEAAVVAQFVAFLKAASDKRVPTGPRQRFNQARASACVNAEFMVLGGLPGEARVGLFAAPRAYRAWIRFANAASASDRDRDIRGMSIRVFDVEGPNLTPGANTQDFVLNSHPVMMAADTKGFMELLQANEAGGLRRALYFLTHPQALRVGMAARTNPSCHLDLSYWSTTPYLFGPRRAVKYVVRPGSARRSPMPPTLTDTYLTDAIRARLVEADATFDFMIQLQTDSRRMPIEDASVEWKQQDSPYVPVARIRIPQQSIDEPGREAQCEQTAFNPWHCLPEHRPLGSMNRARREIYRAMAAFRAEPRR